MSQNKIYITEDGSHTIFNEKINEHYHSIFGAINESKEIFINYGLTKFANFNKINILEVGMGTGLNVFLTLIENLQMHKSINYTAIEPYPVEKEIYLNLNYFDVLNVCDLKK